MNNYERIKAMSIDEMAEWLMQKTYCDICRLNQVYKNLNRCSLFTCKQKYLKIIKQLLNNGLKVRMKNNVVSRYDKWVQNFNRKIGI